MVTVTGILLMQSSGLGRSMDRFSAFLCGTAGMIVFACEQRIWDMVIVLELFL